ncbi:MAG TPA: GrpB family protein [Terriglobales bacterium]|nr:GrpB family protein [Terriglobales bacterium]
MDYDPRWPEMFTREAERIRSVLGRRALRVEHVGSTAVPGLAAKPVIDVLLEVVDSADEAAYALALETAGYVLRIREPGWQQHRLFKGLHPDANLHVFSHGRSEIERMLLFRDWLRSNAADRELYASTKLALGRKKWKDVQDYADAKTAVVEEILARARSAGS